MIIRAPVFEVLDFSEVVILFGSRHASFVRFRADLKSAAHVSMKMLLCCAGALEFSVNS